MAAGNITTWYLKAEIQSLEKIICQDTLSHSHFNLLEDFYSA